MPHFNDSYISPPNKIRNVKIGSHAINPALIVIDMQNGFISKGGSYDVLGMDTSQYQRVIPKIQELIKRCRDAKMPIFYTQAVREESGIDLLTRTHKMLPKSREERIKRRPICVRGKWDAKIIEELSPSREDHVVVKRRDSALQDTEMGVWLRSLLIDTLIFCGVDTSICVETSLRDAFNQGYDVMLVSDATASSVRSHYDSTIEIVRDCYGVILNVEELGMWLIKADVQAGLS